MHCFAKLNLPFLYKLEGYSDDRIEKRLRWKTITCFDQALAECVAKLSGREK